MHTCPTMHSHPRSCRRPAVCSGNSTKATSGINGAVRGTLPSSPPLPPSPRRKHTPCSSCKESGKPFEGDGEGKVREDEFHGGRINRLTFFLHNLQGTRTQADQGVKDSAKAFFEDTKKSAKELARDDLIEVLTGQSASAVHWLQDVVSSGTTGTSAPYASKLIAERLGPPSLQFKLDLSVLGRLGGHSYERTHRGGAQFPG